MGGNSSKNKDKKKEGRTFGPIRKRDDEGRLMPPPAPRRTWDCKHCTLKNPNNTRKCSACYNLRGTPSGGPRPSGGAGGRSFGPRPSGGAGGRSFGSRPSGGGGGGGDFLGKFRTAHLRGDAHGMPYIDPSTQKTITNRLLENTRKGGHYSWYIFPQLAGLARSGPHSLSSKYAIKNIREAQAFLRDPVLGGHLREYTRAVLQLLNPGGGGGGRNVDMYAQLVRILGSTDAMKFISSMTLFLEAAEKNGNAADQRLFGAVIQQIGPPHAPDEMTLALLKSSSDAQRRRLGGGTRRRRNHRKRKKTRRRRRRKKQKTRRRQKRYYSRRRLK